MAFCFIWTTIAAIAQPGSNDALFKQGDEVFDLALEDADQGLRLANQTLTVFLSCKFDAQKSKEK